MSGPPIGRMPAVGSVVLGIRLVLAAVFAVAGVAKLFDRNGSRQALADFGVPAPAVPVAAWLLPLVELATAIALIPPSSARWGALAALVLLLGFVAGIANALRHGKDVDCGCFGKLYSAVAGRATMARNAALAVGAGIVLWQGPGPSIGDWVSARTAAELVAIAAVAAALRPRRGRRSTVARAARPQGGCRRTPRAARGAPERAAGRRRRARVRAL